jgi:hypothetical protein
MTMALKSPGANSDPGSEGDDPAVQYTRLLTPCVLYTRLLTACVQYTRLLTACVQYTRLLTPCVLIGRPRGGGAWIAESSDGVS